jgi:hypothetical protein
MNPCLWQVEIWFIYKVYDSECERVLMIIWNVMHFLFFMDVILDEHFIQVDYPSRSQTFQLKSDSDHSRYTLLSVALLQIMGVLNVQWFIQMLKFIAFKIHFWSWWCQEIEFVWWRLYKTKKKSMYKYNDKYTFCSGKKSYSQM